MRAARCGQSTGDGTAHPLPDGFGAGWAMTSAGTFAAWARVAGAVGWNVPSGKPPMQPAAAA
jgi:hypothetical protein